MKWHIRSIGAPLGVLLLGVMLSGCADDDGGPGATCYQATSCAGDLLCVGPRSADGLPSQAAAESDGPGRCTLVSSSDPGSVYTDPLTKLEWQQTPTGGSMDWGSAVKHCQRLSLDGSGWRLPTVEELRSLIVGCPTTQSGGACAATSACITYDICLRDCSGCNTLEGPTAGCYWPSALGGECSWYWTSTSLDDNNGAWYLVFAYAHVCGRSKEQQYGLVRCVR